MWIRKTEREIKAEHNRKTLIIFFSILFVSLFISIMLDIFVYSKIEGNFNPQELLEKTMFRVPRYFAIALIFAFIGTRWKERRLAVCLRCNRAKRFDQISACECGGEYVELDKLKWVSDVGGREEESL
ncbi:MAG: hypothetical protein PHV55_03985 [Candidatus Omnitrophica bacterium]|nr:hypothetical protein [Candidatus Omnitrophota bacterium]